MKFATQLLSFVALAIAASHVVVAEAPVYRRSALPDGTLLPRAELHPRLDVIRRQIIDEYFSNNPEKRAELAHEFIEEAVVEKREPEPEWKGKKHHKKHHHHPKKHPQQAENMGEGESGDVNNGAENWQKQQQGQQDGVQSNDQSQHQDGDKSNDQSSQQQDGDKSNDQSSQQGQEEDCEEDEDGNTQDANQGQNDGQNGDQNGDQKNGGSFVDSITNSFVGQSKRSVVEERSPSLEDQAAVNDEMKKRDVEDAADLERRGIKSKRCENDVCHSSKHKHHRPAGKHPHRHRHGHKNSAQADGDVVDVVQSVTGDNGVDSISSGLTGTVSAHVKVSSNINGKKSSSEWGSTKNIGGTGRGFIGIDSIEGKCCKKPGADKLHPNGSPSFLACGISKSNPHSKWCPPHVEMSQLKIASLDEAANSKTFGPCGKFKAHFKTASDQTGINPVVLMSIAMQESTCDDKCKGANGEIGAMQVTKDKCKNVDCWDIATNILVGAKYFASELKKANGNFLIAAGNYNGWFDGMSYADATKMMNSNCHAQQNLDYLNQLVNGWLLAIDSYSVKYLTTFNNLAGCSD